MGLGEKIYQLRSEKGMSQGDLADAVEVSRQSISKWETNSSVPELDKLVKLSNIFGVSLDELVLDKNGPKRLCEPEMKGIHRGRTEQGAARKITGIILLCFSVLLWLMIALFGDIIAGLVLMAPVAACGLICLLVRRYAGLWCAWVGYLFVDIYLRFATGINMQYVFVGHVYAGGWTIHLIVAWCLFVVFATLVTVTALQTRKICPGSLCGDLIGMASGWAVYLITRVVFTLPLMEAQIAAGYSQVYRYVSAVSGWVRSIVLTVSMVFAVRAIASLLGKRKK